MASNVKTKGKVYTEDVNRAPTPGHTRGAGYEPESELSPPLENSLANLSNSLGNAHAAISSLTDTLQPYLPNRMFDDNEEGAVSEDKAEVGYAEYGSEMSPTLTSVNKALNELNRLIKRIHYVNGQVVR